MTHGRGSDVLQRHYHVMHDEDRPKKKTRGVRGGPARGDSPAGGVLRLNKQHNDPWWFSHSFDSEGIKCGEPSLLKAAPCSAVLALSGSLTPKGARRG